ncbi:hypothetical protein [Paenibacillus amylolyticus]|uniref:hypothetical protein n=1 Tax=Paenibacillus amylolyticus TaxID=1451 RepID=UPI0039AEFEB4
MRTKVEQNRLLYKPEKRGDCMKLGSILGILLLATAIVYGEWKSSKEKRARIVSAGITAVAAVIGIILLFQPRLPGPTQIVKLVFGSVDKFMK